MEFQNAPQSCQTFIIADALNTTYNGSEEFIHTLQSECIGSFSLVDEEYGMTNELDFTCENCRLCQTLVLDSVINSVLSDVDNLALTMYANCEAEIESDLNQRISESAHCEKKHECYEYSSDEQACESIDYCSYYGRCNIDYYGQDGGRSDKGEEEEEDETDSLGLGNALDSVNIPESEVALCTTIQETLSAKVNQGVEACECTTEDCSCKDEIESVCNNLCDNVQSGEGGEDSYDSLGLGNALENCDACQNFLETYKMHVRHENTFGVQRTMEYCVEYFYEAFTAREVCDGISSILSQSPELVAGADNAESACQAIQVLFSAQNSEFEMDPCIEMVEFFLGLTSSGRLEFGFDTFGAICEAVISDDQITKSSWHNLECDGGSQCCPDGFTREASLCDEIPGCSAGHDCYLKPEHEICGQYHGNKFGCDLRKSEGCEFIQDGEEENEGHCELMDNPCEPGRTSKATCEGIKVDGESICAVRDMCHELQHMCDPEDRCCLEGTDNTADKCSQKAGCTFKATCESRADPCDGLNEGTCITSSECLWISTGESDGFCFALLDPCEQRLQSECESLDESCRLRHDCERMECNPQDECCPVTNEDDCDTDKGCSWSATCELLIDECEFLHEKETCDSNPSCQFISSVEDYFNLAGSDDDHEDNEIDDHFEVYSALQSKESQNCTCKPAWFENQEGSVMYGCSMLTKNFAICETDSSCGTPVTFENSTASVYFDTCAPEGMCDSLFEVWMQVELHCAKLSSECVLPGLWEGAQNSTACEMALASFAEAVEVAPDHSDVCDLALRSHISDHEVYDSLKICEDGGSSRRKLLSSAPLHARRLMEEPSFEDRGHCESIEDWGVVCESLSEDTFACNRAQHPSGRKLCKVTSQCEDTCGNCLACRTIMGNIDYKSLDKRDLPQLLFDLCYAEALLRTDSQGRGPLETCGPIYDIVKENPEVAYRPNVLCPLLELCPEECLVGADRCENLYEDVDESLIKNSSSIELGMQLLGEVCFESENCLGDMICQYGETEECQRTCDCDPDNGLNECSPCAGTCVSFCSEFDDFLDEINGETCDIALNSSFPASGGCDEGLVCQASEDCAYCLCDAVNGINCFSCDEAGKGLCLPAQSFMISAKLANSGRTATVTMNDKISPSSTLPCSAIFANSTASLMGQEGSPAWCKTSGKTIKIYFGYGATILSGHELELSDDALIFSSSSNLPFDTSVKVVLQDCDNCEKPEVSLFGPKVVGADCSGNVMDIHLSSFVRDKSGRQMDEIKWYLEKVGGSISSDAQAFIDTMNADQLEVVSINGSLLAAGTYTATLEATSWLGSANSSWEFEREEQPVPVISVVGPQTKEFFVSEGITVDMSIDSQSACDQISYNWTSPTSSSILSGIKVNRKDLYFPPRSSGFMSGQTYTLILTASLGAKSSSAEVILKPIASDLVVTLDAPNGDIPNDKDLVMSASQSYDPDDPSDTYGSKVFTWQCQKINGQPCFSGLYSPFNNGTHYIVSYNSTEGTRRLEADTFYIFTVSVSKGGRSQSATAVVSVIEGNLELPIGKIEILCSTSVCTKKHDSDKRLILEAVQDTSFTDVQYIWDGVLGSNIKIIEPSQLESGGTSEFKVLFSRTSSGSSVNSSATISVEMNSKPVCLSATGCVTATPTSGLALGGTAFTLQGNNFFDDEELKYEFGYYKDSKQVVKGSSSVAEKVFNSFKPGNHTLFICAKDTFGSKLCQTTVIEAKEKVVEISDVLISELENELNSTQKSGDTDSSIEVAMKMAQTFKVGKDTSNSTNTTSTVSTIQAQNEKLADFAKGILSVTDVNDQAVASEKRSAVVELLSEVTGDSELVSKETAKTSVETLLTAAKMGDMDDSLVDNTAGVLSAALSGFTQAVTAESSSPSISQNDTTSTNQTQTTSAAVQEQAQLLESVQETFSLVASSIISDVVPGLDPPKVVSTESFDIVASKDDSNSLMGLTLSTIPITQTQLNRKLLQDANGNEFKVEFSDDFGTKCSESIKCPNPLTSSVTYMKDPSLLLGTTNEISLEPGVADVEVISGVATLTQNRVGVITESPLNITLPVTNSTVDINKNRACLFVDPITGDLVGYTSSGRQGWTTCPRGYSQPCTEVVQEDSSAVTCQVQATGQYLAVQFSKPVYPSPPPPPPTFQFSFPPPPDAVPAPPPPPTVLEVPPPPPSVLNILSGSGDDDDIVIVIAGAVGGFVVLALMFGAFYYVKKTKKAKASIKDAKKVEVGTPVAEASPTATLYPPVTQYPPA